jgi:hypothetical protein
VAQTSVRVEVPAGQSTITPQFPRLALEENAGYAPGTKTDPHRARYFPSGHPLSAGGPFSPSREFSFALHQIQPAIESHISLQHTLYSWNQIARGAGGKLAQAITATTEMAYLIKSFQRRNEAHCPPTTHGSGLTPAGVAKAKQQRGATMLRNALAGSSRP